MSRGFGKTYWFGLVLSVAITAAYVYGRDIFAKYESFLANEEGVRALERDRDALAAERDLLQERVNRLSSDPVEIEASIRRSKNMVRINERIYRIELPDDETEATPSYGDRHTPDTGDSAS